MAKNNCKNKCNKCEDGLIPTDRVYYSGEYLPNLGVPPGMILTEVLGLIDQYLGSFNPPPSDFNIKSGTSTATGNGSSLDYSFPHGLGILPTGVSVDPATGPSADNYSISFNSTQITVSYSVAPSPGEELSWTWIVIKSNV